MKKIVISCSLIIILGLSFQNANAFTSKYTDFWQNFFNRYDTRVTRQTSTPSAPVSMVNTRNNTDMSLRSRFDQRRLLRSQQNSPRDTVTIPQNNPITTPVRPLFRQPTPTTNQPSLLTTISSTSSNRDIYEITDQPVSVFKLGVRNNTRSSSSRLPTSALLDEVTFQLISRNGIFEDPRDFVLTANEEEFRFSDNGLVTLRFNNARLAESETLQLDIAIKVDNPDTIGYINGTAMLRLLDITASREFSSEAIPVTVNGNRVSQRIAYNPISVITSGQNSTIVSTSGSSIYGDLLKPNEEKFILAAKFNASFDDLAIRRITVRNTATGNQIDSLLGEVQAVNLNTGELLDTANFTNGEARFLFSPRVTIRRNNNVNIGFKVAVRNNPRNSGDRRMKLHIMPSDVVVESLSNGRELSNGNKNFNIDSQTFAVVESELAVSPLTQTNNIIIGTNSPERVFDFQVSNTSPESAALGRISFDVNPNGLDFAGGSISSDDFELTELLGNSENATNTAVIVSGNTVRFDFANESRINGNNNRTFRLKVALVQTGTSGNNDGVSVRVLTDNNYVQGNLATVRASGANFIWSDDSANNHSAATDDWFSGYRLEIPSSPTYIKR